MSHDITCGLSYVWYTSYVWVQAVKDVVSCCYICVDWIWCVNDRLLSMSLSGLLYLSNSGGNNSCAVKPMRKQAGTMSHLQRHVLAHSVCMCKPLNSQHAVQSCAECKQGVL